MKLNGIQGRMGLLFMAFFLIVTVSVGATFWGIEAQKKDALVINLAGRQRMLIQETSRLALEIEKSKDNSRVSALQEASNTFEQTLKALTDGGSAPYLPGSTVEVPATNDRDLRDQLQQVQQSWQSYSNSLEVIQRSDPETPQFTTAIQAVESLSPELVNQADLAVRMYEAASNQKTTILRWVQIGFFISALALLLGGALMTRKSIIEPLGQLERSAENIGKGDLSTPVHIDTQGEVKVLADTLDSMRGQLMTSHKELLEWANHLEERVGQRTRELEALYQVSRDISSRLDVQHVLHSVTDKARELLKAEVAFLCLLDDQEHVLNLHATSGPAEAVVQSQASVSEGLLTNQVLTGIRALPCGIEDCMGSCEMIAEYFRKSHLAAPLRIDTRVIGALCVGSPEAGVFSEEAENLLTKLANSAAIALENARLHAQTERLAILEERQRIAADMHDGLAQTVSYLQLEVDQANEQIENGQIELAFETLQRVHRVIDRSNLEIRRAIASLQEDFPLHYTLQEQLSELAEEFSQSNSEVLWVCEVNQPLVLAHDQTEQILRVMREALSNAKRHSKAEHIQMRLEQNGNQVYAMITDDGQGFDPDSPFAEDGRQHFGLDIMHARAARMGGNININSQPGAGTQIILTWQIEENRRESDQ